MKTVVTELAFLFVWISLCCGRVLLSGGNRPSFCLLTKETGVCRAALPRWYYNINSGKCEQFIYGGCGGNENNFGTSDECEGNCTTNTGEEGRIADKTSVMFRRRLRRDTDSNPVTQPKNGGNAAETTVPPSQVGSPSKTKSNSSKPEKNSQDPTNRETNPVTQPKNGGNVAETTVPPSKSQVGSPSQTKSNSSKPEKNSQDPTSRETNPVTQPKNGGNVAETTVPPSKSQVGSPSQTKSNSSKPEENSHDGKNVKASLDDGEPTGVETTESPTQPEDVSSGKLDEIPSEPEEGTNEDVEDILDFSRFQTSRKDSAAYPYEHTSSHFAAFFLTSIVMVFAAYVVYHNRQKIIAIVIEGRSEGNGRRRGYRKLETNVEEAMPSLKSSNSTYVY